MTELTKPSFTFLLAAFLLASATFGQEKSPVSQYKSVDPKKGERCIVCGVQLTEEDVVLIVRGRRVPLNQTMVDSFLNNKSYYFAKLQPRSALFQENLEAPQGVAQGGISLGWFLFGLYVLIALIFSGFSGYTAVSKGLPPIRYFFIGLVFSVFGYIYVLTRSAEVGKDEIPEGLVKVPSTKAPVPCPKCDNTNHPSAKHCLECGAKLKPATDSEVSRTA